MAAMVLRHSSEETASKQDIRQAHRQDVMHDGARVTHRGGKGGCQSRGSGGRKFPSGVQGGAPVGVRGRIPQKLIHFRHFEHEILK